MEVMKIKVTSFKTSHACTATLSAPSPAGGHHRPTPPLETPGHSQGSLVQSAALSGPNTEKARKFQKKKSTSALLTMPKPFDCMDHNKLWEILKEMEIPEHLTCLRNLYAGHETTVRIGHGTTD